MGSEVWGGFQGEGLVAERRNWPFECPIRPRIDGGFQANCIDSPSACGYPDETNTGVPAGVSLTPSGSITVSEDGAVIENLDIEGQVVIRANNVTIRNTRITSCE